MTISFLLLPVELQHHVAMYCSTRDILALTATCVLLHNFFGDSIMFRQAFINTVPLVSSRSIHSKESLADRITQQLSKPENALELDQVDQRRVMWKCLSISTMRMLRMNDELDRLKATISSGEEIVTSRIKDSLRMTIRLLSVSIVWDCQSGFNDTTMKSVGELCLGIYTFPSLRPYLSEMETELSFCLSLCCIHQSAQGFSISLAIMTISLICLNSKLSVGQACNDSDLSSASNSTPPRPEDIEFFSKRFSRPPLQTVEFESREIHAAESIPLPSTRLESFAEEYPTRNWDQCGNRSKLHRPIVRSTAPIWQEKYQRKIPRRLQMRKEAYAKLKSKPSSWTVPQRSSSFNSHSQKLTTS
ncbi:hypothetical protein DM02DRAFT_654345 [Periconia macrospinosa]|uniref:F-box domain-containing protein n=1 Tax=Periconia macrospinosa TaxID=97972 RepID=A0A2V1DU52_9PLEO|nr:hypothetical protein DM02DRAFT_654345 [Periconia macrospinosa]